MPQLLSDPVNEVQVKKAARWLHENSPNDADKITEALAQRLSIALSDSLTTAFETQSNALSEHLNASLKGTLGSYTKNLTDQLLGGGETRNGQRKNPGLSAIGDLVQTLKAARSEGATKAKGASEKQLVNFLTA